MLKISGLVALVDASPDIASLRVNGMLTFVLFQPFAFGTGEGVPNVKTGGVASRLMFTDSVVVPAPDVTLHVNVVPAVSVSIRRSSQPLDARMWFSTTFQWSWTSSLCHTEGPITPLTNGCTSGGM